LLDNVVLAFWDLSSIYPRIKLLSLNHHSTSLYYRNKTKCVIVELATKFIFYYQTEM
jgi:hypothetical protein